MENQLPNGERLIEEPTYPEDWECCDNGCEELCVYEIYRVQKQAYDEPVSYTHLTLPTIYSV